MSTFVLVHGAWHGSWCWSIVAEQLRHLGHKVYAIDLPGHYSNKRPFHDITLRTYVEFVKSFINKIDEAVILVGHSMGGIVISQVAEEVPAKIQKLVYVCAFVPNYNGSLMEEEQNAHVRSVGLEVIPDENQSRIIITHSRKLKELFYGMCSAEQAKEAISQLQDQPMRPFIDRVSLSDNNFGRVAKLYIECLKDNAIHISDQRNMNKKLNCPKVILDCDHSPFLSCPEQLVKALNDN